jgi:hypothetical protein
LKNKEKELLNIIHAQKEEYDRMLKARDDEVTAFVDNIVRENQVLKKQIVSLEIDLEYFKEVVNANEGGIIPLSESSSQVDRKFYENLKIIKEANDTKQKELIDKYDKLFRNLTKDTRSNVSSLKRTSLNVKNRILNGDDEDEFIAISQVEEQINIFENRIRLLYEELKTKEKYILVVEHKYEMVNEETRYLKTKISEEKLFFQRKIEEIRTEKDNDHENLMRRMEKEIIEKKENLQQQIENSLRSNSEFINILVCEKNRLKEELVERNSYIDKLEKSGNKNEKRKDDSNKSKVELEVINFNEKKLENDAKKVTNDIDILKRDNEELTVKLNDLIDKNLKLEKMNKGLTDKSEEIKFTEAEIKYKNIIDKLTTDNSELVKQVRLESSENNRLKSSIEKLINDLDNVRTELNNKLLEGKHLNRNIEDLTEQSERYKRQLNNDRDKVNEKDNEYKELREKFMIKETELKTLRIENERILQLKDKHFNQSKHY